MKSWPWIKGLSAVALVFGVLTVISGGNALFGGAAAKAAAGNAVPFVLWFNFLAGFAYVLTALGLLRQRPWAVWAALLLAASTALVGAAFALHVLGGAPYEQRTVIAMGFRLGFWVVLAALAWTSRRRS